jgi:hypothetical protein
LSVDGVRQVIVGHRCADPQLLHGIHDFAGQVFDSSFLATYCSNSCAVRFPARRTSFEISRLTSWCNTFGLPTVLLAGLRPTYRFSDF